MTADELVDFWKEAGASTVHPSDKAHVGNHFATDLRPVPWAGPLKAAKVFFLFLNPGLTDQDTCCEAVNAEFLATLQENLLGMQPYFYLLERFSDHPGYRWAKRIFGAGISEQHTQDICVLQLVPYHSRYGSLAKAVAPRLPSTTAIRGFVLDFLLPRARAGEIGIVVARSRKLWGLGDESEGGTLVIYTGWECRSAFQTANSRGGKLARRLISTARQAAQMPAKTAIMNEAKDFQ